MLNILPWNLYLCSSSPVVEEVSALDKTENDTEVAKKRHLNVVFIGHVGKLISSFPPRF